MGRRKGVRKEQLGELEVVLCLSPRLRDRLLRAIIYSSLILLLENVTSYHYNITAELLRNRPLQSYAGNVGNPVCRIQS